MFGPNIRMVKTSVIPMLIVDEAYRMTPHFLDCLRVCNTLHMKGHTTFVLRSNQPDIVSHGVAMFEGRYAAYEFMAAYGDAVVSHTLENGQNYLYYEPLFGGYPLIHNWPFLGTAAHFYPDRDCDAAGECWRRHLPSTIRISTRTESD
jgi:hypothetical protein